MESERTLTYAEAVSEATDQAMASDPSVFAIGQGTRDRGHIFGTVTGLFDKYGPDRVVEMPLSEQAVAGLAVGAALEGMRPLLVLQRTDFAFLVMDQLVNHASKWRAMFGGAEKVPVTLRLITGRGWGQAPQHSQSLHATFAHFPGLRVVAPTRPDDAKGILMNSIFSDDPTVMIEARPLHQVSGPVPERPYLTPFGRARILRRGKDATLLAVSHFVPDALAAAEVLAGEGVSVEVIDPVSISPWDSETALDSVGRTGRLVVADPSWAPCGFASEVSAVVNERAFGRLRSPVRRVTLPWSPAPAARPLEEAYYPDAKRIAAAVRETLS